MVDGEEVVFDCLAAVDFGGEAAADEAFFHFEGFVGFLVEMRRGYDKILS